ncbi:hypothetical protein BH708_07705 [Brachybacterium sp. P6-10-X1]|nr:hypothetical protein BH708_07705 [Brachybacterium sp. P6-10-X1]
MPVRLMPVMDAAVVLSYGGSLAEALSIHISAAVCVAVTGLLHLWAARRASGARDDTNSRHQTPTQPGRIPQERG